MGNWYDNGEGSEEMKREIAQSNKNETPLIEKYRLLLVENKELKEVISDLVQIGLENGIELWECSECGNISTPDGFDVLGTDPTDWSKCFCNACDQEMSPKILQKGK